MYGPPAIGKSYLALAFAGATTNRGYEVGGFNVTFGSPSVYFDAENGANEMARRLHYMPCFNGQCGEFFEIYEPDCSLDQELTSLVHYIQHHHAGYVILDSLRSLWLAGDCNDPKLVTPFFKQLQEIARKYDTSILILHHTNKWGDYAGTVALTAVPEIAVGIGKHPKDCDPDRRYIEWNKDRLGGAHARQWFRILSTPRGTEIERANRPTKDELWDD
jgi:predicted ATP-dependent serine protease